MKQQILTILFFGFIGSLSAQVEGNKSYSKDVALYRAKEFLMSNVLDTNDRSIEFEVIPLVAEASGELTTLIFNCEEQNKSGLIIGFFNDKWLNPTGVNVESYSFKVFNEEQATEFIDLINKEVDKSWKFLKKNWNNNNLIVRYQDVDVLIWTSSSAPLMRVFWDGYDAEWQSLSFNRSKRRFERKIEKYNETSN